MSEPVNPQPKIEHYIPQCYLKFFTSNKDKKQIFVYDKLTHNIFRTNIKNIANEKYFYDLVQSETQKRNQNVEDFFSKLETYYNTILEATLRMIETKRKITNNMKDAMSLFIAFQLLRTRSQRRHIGELIDIFNKTLLEETHKFSEEEKTVLYELELDEDYVKSQHIDFIFNSDILNSYIKALDKHICIIGLNNTSTPLYTSDHPVVKKAHKKDKIHSYSGISSEGIEIAFPLTPKYILILKEKRFFRSLQNNNLKLILINNEDVTYYNSLQIFQSERQIYCPSNNFKQIEEAYRANPSAFQIERKIATKKYIGTHGTLIQFKDQIE